MIQLLWKHEVSVWIMVDVSQWFSTRSYISRRERTRSSVHGTVPNKMRRWLIDLVLPRRRSKIRALFTVAGMVYGVYDIHPSYFHETRDFTDRLWTVIYLELVLWCATNIFELNQYSSIYIESIVNMQRNLYHTSIHLHIYSLISGYFSL